ncbi:hypothetical protein BROUX41_005470 [Berkeleyomyces rouxiae]|uniref:uncharacterized protein n=1 Tax=Berkeleyomyces rouxiae TaxID=2035830 RepID=UPI003B78E7FB
MPPIHSRTYEETEDGECIVCEETIDGDCITTLFEIETDEKFTSLCQSTVHEYFNTVYKTETAEFSSTLETSDTSDCHYSYFIHEDSSGAHIDEKTSTPGSKAHYLRIPVPDGHETIYEITDQDGAFSYSSTEISTKTSTFAKNSTSRGDFTYYKMSFNGSLVTIETFRNSEGLTETTQVETDQGVISYSKIFTPHDPDSVNHDSGGLSSDGSGHLGIFDTPEPSPSPTPSDSSQETWTIFVDDTEDESSAPPFISSSVNGSGDLHEWTASDGDGFTSDQLPSLLGSPNPESELAESTTPSVNFSTAVMGPHTPTSSSVKHLRDDDDTSSEWEDSSERSKRARYSLDTPDLDLKSTADVYGGDKEQDYEYYADKDYE